MKRKLGQHRLVGATEEFYAEPGFPDFHDRLCRYLKTELKRADVTYAELSKRLAKHGLKNETEISAKNKVICSSYAATYLMACLAALEME